MLVIARGGNRQRYRRWLTFRQVQHGRAVKAFLVELRTSFHLREAPIDTVAYPVYNVSLVVSAFDRYHDSHEQFMTVWDYHLLENLSNSHQAAYFNHTSHHGPHTPDISQFQGVVSRPRGSASCKPGKVISRLGGSANLIAVTSSHRPKMPLDS